MGKRLIIVGANFAENKIDQEPIPQEVEWSIGTISSTGVIGAEANGIHTNLVNMVDALAVLDIVVLDASAFGKHGAMPGVVAYDASGTFIVRVLAPAGTLRATLSKAQYSNAAKVRFLIGGYAAAVTNVDTALSKVDYTVTGI